MNEYFRDFVIQKQNTEFEIWSPVVDGKRRYLGYEYTRKKARRLIDKIKAHYEQEICGSLRLLFRSRLNDR